MRLPVANTRRDLIVALYGPLLLIFLLVVWALSLVAGFGLMLHALDASGSAARSLGDSIYLSGATFFTLGLGDVLPATAAAKVLTIIEAGTGFCGFLAMIIGYLPVFYQAFSRREVAISLLDAHAGSPPTALELIRRNGDRVAEQVLQEWEPWAAELLESHLSYPVLTFFRSQHEKQSWLAALTVILDSCALIMTGLEGMPARQARFTYGIARHALVDLTQTFFAEPRPPEPPRLDHDSFVALAAQLAAEGYPFTLGDAAEATLATWRSGYEPLANALGERLLFDLPPWIPDQETEPTAGADQPLGHDDLVRATAQRQKKRGHFRGPSSLTLTSRRKLTPGFDLGGFRRLQHLPLVGQRCLEAIDAVRQDRASRQHSIELGLVDARRHDALVAQVARLVDQAAAHANDPGVGHAQVLVVALIDNAHRLGDGAVLAATGDAAPADAAGVGDCRLLHVAVDVEVVAAVTGEVEAPEPVCRVVRRVGVVARRHTVDLLSAGADEATRVGRVLDAHREAYAVLIGTTAMTLRVVKLAGGIA